jgi:uncharacterized repeat protein (TIGR03803 family)
VRALRFSRYALSLCAAAALLAGCGAESVTPLERAAVRKEAMPAYNVLYAFRGSDGAYPAGNLTSLNGALYGATSSGGSVYCSSFGCGTVFKITTAGSLKILYSFRGFFPDHDGQSPWAGVMDLNGTFYGTTHAGGAANSGTVFAVTTSGKESVLHSFPYGGSESPPDGCLPTASLTSLNGTLYGTTTACGAHGGGAVFRITTSGSEMLIYSFHNPYTSGNDGYDPEAALIDVNGTLYGATYHGGVYSDGTVFEISTSGKETVLHSFEGGTDGANPGAGLINVKGTLYGTTARGGKKSGCPDGSYNGCGTVFKITTSGAETVLYRFAGGSDGEYPDAALTYVRGTLYGTTALGGTKACGAPFGCGTVLRLTTAGSETVLHRFGSGSDGWAPQAGLTNVNGTLYGTTPQGGTYRDGTVYSLSP